VIIVDRRFDQARCVFARNGRLFAITQPLRSIGARWELGTRRRGQLGKLASGRIQIPVHARRIAESPQSDTYARNAGRVVTDRAAHARCDAREGREQCSRTREEAGAPEFHCGRRLKMDRQCASLCLFSPSIGRTRGDSNRRSPAHGPLLFQWHKKPQVRGNDPGLAASGVARAPIDCSRGPIWRWRAPPIFPTFPWVSS